MNKQTAKKRLSRNPLTRGSRASREKTTTSFSKENQPAIGPKAGRATDHAMNWHLLDASYKEVPLLNGQQKRTRRGTEFFASTEG
jgi:hypothetical protein